MQLRGKRTIIIKQQQSQNAFGGKVHNYYREIFYTLRQNKKKNTSSKQSQNVFGGKVHNYYREIFYTLRQNKKKNTIIHPLVLYSSCRRCVKKP